MDSSLPTLTPTHTPTLHFSFLSVAHTYTHPYLYSPIPILTHTYTHPYLYSPIYKPILTHTYTHQYLNLYSPIPIFTYTYTHMITLSISLSYTPTFCCSFKMMHKMVIIWQLLLLVRHRTVVPPESLWVCPDGKNPLNNVVRFILTLVTLLKLWKG